MTTSWIDHMEWTLLGVYGAFEYWRKGDNVFRRKATYAGQNHADGSPMGVRWDSAMWHFETYVASRLPV